MIKPRQSLLVLLAVLPWAANGSAFEGRVQTLITQGSETRAFLYTVGPNHLRIERTETDWPFAKNIINLDSGALTLIFPHNRSFVRLKPASESGASPFPDMPAMPPAAGGLPPGIGPQASVATPPAGVAVTGHTDMPVPPAAKPMPAVPKIADPHALPGMPVLPPGVGPQAGATPGAIAGAPPMAGMPAMGAMPMMPMPGMDKLELRATGDKKNLLGYDCLRYEIKQHGEVMEIWATDQLPPFQAWQQNQPARLGPRLIEEQWADLLKARKLFPLLATLKFDNGPERLRFEVTAIKPEKIEDSNGQLFQPPAAYHELDPLPF